jgi:hypothetical protein
MTDGLIALAFGQELAHTFQLALGAVFLPSAAPKLRHPAVFRRTVAEYRLLPRRLTLPVAALVIGLELLLAIAFLIGWMAEAAVPLAGAMLVGFSVAIAINLHRGRRISCGCFGGDAETISMRSLGRLSMLSLVVVLLAVLPAFPVTMGEIAADEASAAAYLIPVVTAAGALLLSGLWLTNAREAAFVLGHLRPIGGVKQSGTDLPDGLS